MTHTTPPARTGRTLTRMLGGGICLLLPALFLVLSPDLAGAQEEAVISSGDTAWMLISTALVLFMTAGLAFFYGGLVPSKNVLNTMMMSFIAFGVAGVLWAVAGYSLAFGPGNAFVGDLSMAFLSGVGMQPNGTIPDILFMAFQGTFYIITAALISGAVVGRMRFGPYVAFISLWGLLVYAPVCHWVWQENGWLYGLGALDFAGGTVVHVNAGAGAVAAALVLGTRSEYGRSAMLPHNVPFVLLGAGILWFGWMGFNGGSALAADGLAALGVVNTLLAPAAALVAWALLDMVFAKQITAVGAATGIVVGLVAVTPASGWVSPMSAIAIGAIAAVPSYFIIRWRVGTGLDDSLDVFAAHGVGGATGAILTGVFATAAWGGSDGLLGGNPGQVWIQAVSVLSVFAYSAIGSVVILKVIQAVAALRPSADLERRGMDLIAHGEEGYATGDGAVIILDEELNGGEEPTASVGAAPVAAS